MINQRAVPKGTSGGNREIVSNEISQSEAYNTVENFSSLDRAKYLLNRKSKVGIEVGSKEGISLETSTREMYSREQIVYQI